jgi:hypothetical protein
MGYKDIFASSTQKHKKVIETPNQPIGIKKISNKSKKGGKNLYGDYPSLQAQPKILKKLSEHQLYQSKRKFS